MTSNQKAVKKYQEGRDAIMLRPSKEDGAKIRAAAASAGLSVQAYVFRALTHPLGSGEDVELACIVSADYADRVRSLCASRGESVNGVIKAALDKYLEDNSPIRF